MNARRLGLLPLVLYVVLDFANPMLPGAVSFDIDESVDAIRADRPAPRAAAATAPQPLRLLPVTRAESARPVVVRGRQPIAPPLAARPVVRGLPARSSDPPPSDDH